MLVGGLPESQTSLTCRIEHKKRDVPSRDVPRSFIARTKAELSPGAFQ